MRKIIFLLCVSFALFSCDKNKSLQKPNNILSEQQMVDIITDMRIAEAGVSLQNIEYSQMQKLRSTYYNAIYKKYKINEKQFSTSHNYYAYHPKIMVNIYEKVIEKLASTNVK